MKEEPLCIEEFLKDFDVTLDDFYDKLIAYRNHRGDSDVGIKDKFMKSIRVYSLFAGAFPWGRDNRWFIVNDKWRTEMWRRNITLDSKLKDELVSGRIKLYGKTQLKDIRTKISGNSSMSEI